MAARYRTHWLVAALILAAAPWLTEAKADRVGAAAAVNPEATGTPPGGQIRAIQIGTDVFADELISTGVEGSMQIMFLDMSTMTVGPNSDLVIDRFVFDPNQGSGEFTAKLTKGALRFVGGAISHNAGATVTTPTATIGIRGGGAFIQFLNQCRSGRRSARRAGHAEPCTRVLCTAGAVCTVQATNRPNASVIAVDVGRAIEITNLGAANFVTLSNESTRLFVKALTTGKSEEGDEENLETIEVGDNITPTGNIEAQNQIEEVQLPAPPPPPPPNFF